MVSGRGRYCIDDKGGIEVDAAKGERMLLPRREDEEEGTKMCRKKSKAAGWYCRAIGRCDMSMRRFLSIISSRNSSGLSEMLGRLVSGGQFKGFSWNRGTLWRRPWLVTLCRADSCVLIKCAVGLFDALVPGMAVVSKRLVLAEELCSSGRARGEIPRWKAFEKQLELGRTQRGEEESIHVIHYSSRWSGTIV